MRRFLFPLERVRVWRLGQAALEELKLEQLGERMNRLREEKRAMEGERAASEREVLGQASVGQAVLDAADLVNLDAFRLHANRKVRDIENRERGLETLRAQQRQRVIEARRDAELLERLKRQAFDEWQAESGREDEAVAAELYLAKRSRKR